MPYVPYIQRVWGLQVRNVFHVWLVNSNVTPNQSAGLEQSWACRSGRMWLLHPSYRGPVIASPIIPNKRWKSHKQLFRPSWASSVAYWWMCRDVWLPAYVCTYVHKLTLPPLPQATQHCFTAEVWVGAITSDYVFRHLHIPSPRSTVQWPMPVV